MIEKSGKRSLRRPVLSTRNFSAWKKKMYTALGDVMLTKMAKG